MSDDAVSSRAREVLHAQWRAEGFTVPNASRYPWQFLWDSSFHAVAWTALGEPDRAVHELTSLFADQSPSGFVPHIRYTGGDAVHADFWGRPSTSCLTQPPMYGHALAVSHRAGTPLPVALVAAAKAGIRHLLSPSRRSAHGLVLVFHPWESGCDDSPRWDSACPGGFDPTRWRARKGELVAALRVDETTGDPVGSDEFSIGSAGFTALVAWNARELAAVTGDGELEAAALDVSLALDARWDPQHRTWVDDGPYETASGRIRTLDALLPVLVTQNSAARAAVLADLVDANAHGAQFGPTGVHRGEPCYDPRTYWRGPAWPQLTYLLWCAARGRDATVASTLAGSLRSGAARSGFAEYWHPDTGEGLGAIPQSWTALAAAVPPS